jgi:hypothetical protein
VKLKKVVDKYTSTFARLKSTKQKDRKSSASQNGSSSPSSSSNTSALDKIARTSLLLNAVQMVREDYPLPFDTTCAEKLADYVHTKDEYEPVTSASPLFAIDCEMCYNEDGQMEIVWLAMVNEGLECVYETFVRPEKRIRNYLTSYEYALYIFYLFLNESCEHREY